MLTKEWKAMRDEAEVGEDELDELDELGRPTSDSLSPDSNGATAATQNGG